MMSAFNNYASQNSPRMSSIQVLGFNHPKHSESQAATLDVVGRHDPHFDGNIQSSAIKNSEFISNGEWVRRREQALFQQEMNGDIQQLMHEQSAQVNDKILEVIHKHIAEIEF